MPDQPPASGLLEPGGSATADPGIDHVGAALSAAILARDGVLRIEPTLFRVARSLAGPSDPAQHLRVSQRGGMVDLSVNLAVRADHEARSLAHWVRDDLRHCITGLGLTPGTVEISILTIEPVAAPA